MKKQVLTALLFVVSANIHAAPNIIGDQFWLEISAGGDHAGFQLKTAEGNDGWALGAFGYEDTDFFSTNSYYNNDGSKKIDESVGEISILRFYRKHTRLLYSDFGFGLGYVKGTEAENCSLQPQRDGYFDYGSTYFCDEVDIRSPSIPLEANFIFGRYVGIGLKLRLTVAKDFNTAVAGINIPLGAFTHGNQ